MTFPTQVLEKKPKPDGCRMKLTRNKEGKVVKYEDNGKCGRKGEELLRDGVESEQEQE